IHFQGEPLLRLTWANFSNNFPSRSPQSASKASLTTDRFESLQLLQFRALERSRPLSNARLLSLRIHQQVKRSRNWSRAGVWMLLSWRRRLPEFGGIHKNLVCFRIKTHSLCAEFGFYLPRFAVVVRGIL